MKQHARPIDAVYIAALIVLIPGSIFAASVLKGGERSLGVVENIYGIPYPKTSDGILIEEEMAHADLFLQESVFAKTAKITVNFDPGNATAIDIGVRENEFWLSYRKYPLYRAGVDALGVQTKEIMIPLTDAMQDINQSIDLMFFAENSAQSVQWRIQGFYASLFTDMPSMQEIKAYGKSILNRERPL